MVGQAALVSSSRNRLSKWDFAKLKPCLKLCLCP